MPTARLMTRPEDLEKLGLTPGVVQQWEDGRRDGDEPGHNEVWYFDANMDDGTKVVVGFRPKAPADMGRTASSPNLNVNITTPDGKDYVDMILVDPADSTMSTEHCSVHYGPHYAEGDLKSYDVEVVPVNGVGVKLHYEALVEPYRAGGTAHVALGDNDEFYYTDQSVPRNKVTGTVTAGGKTWEVSGSGYHDHQWMNIHPFAAWHHWLWGRFYTERYTVVIYDFVTSERFGFTDIPIFGILDKSGKVIFDNRGPAELEVETYHEPHTDKDYPKTSRYTFHDGERTVHFNVEWIDEIEIRNTYGGGGENDEKYGMSTPEERAKYDQMDVQPTYMRYFAKGDLEIIDANGTDTESGTMIYEYNYPGKPDPRAHI